MVSQRPESYRQRQSHYRNGRQQHRVRAEHDSGGPGHAGRGCSERGVRLRCRGYGSGALSFGAFFSARNHFSTALSYASFAPADRATAKGYGTNATGDGATAIGTGAEAAHANSTALGAGARTTAASQVMLGGAGSSVVVADIAASTAAQQGTFNLVTVDAGGTPGRGAAVATAASVESLRAEVAYIAAVGDGQFADLSGRVGTIENRMNKFDLRPTGVEGGIAVAMAMGEAKLVPDSKVSMTFAAQPTEGSRALQGRSAGWWPRRSISRVRSVATSPTSAWRCGIGIVRLLSAVRRESTFPSGPAPSRL